MPDHQTSFFCTRKRDAGLSEHVGQGGDPTYFDESGVLLLCQLLAIGSWITWFISSWDKNDWFYQLSNFVFYSKWSKWFENKFLFRVKIVVILWICSLFILQELFLSQQEACHVMSQQLTHSPPPYIWRLSNIPARRHTSWLILLLFLSC